MNTIMTRIIVGSVAAAIIGLGAAAPASATENVAAAPPAAVAPSTPVGASSPAAGNIVSGIFYVRVQIDSKDGSGKTFIGNGGGIFTPGAGALIGDIYTDDAARLYSDTVSFQTNAAGAYVNVNFFDADGNLLGSLHAGGVGTVAGVGGGSGSWR